MKINGVTTVKQLRDCDKDAIDMSGIDKIVKLAEAALPGCCPLKIVDHRQMDNPYKSRHGDSWETVIKTTTALSPFVSINDIVLEMAEAARDVMSGTIFANKWLFYHDALCS